MTNRPEKSGYYWFRGEISYDNDEPFAWSGAVFVRLEPEELCEVTGVWSLGVSDPDPLEWYKGEWFELTEEKICGTPR